MKVKKWPVAHFLCTLFVILGVNSCTGFADSPSLEEIKEFIAKNKIRTEGMEEFTLENGMRFVALPNKRFPVVTHHLIYHVGSVNEPAGKSGLAHFLEHLGYSLGTEKHNPSVFAKQLLRAGENADNNAFTSFDTTEYFITCPSEKLEKVFELEADRMRGLKFEKNIFDNEKNVVLEEYLMRVGNNSEGQLNQVIHSSFFWTHPYRILPIGWKSEILGLSIEDAIEFYNKWYVPSNATCIIVGDITVEKVKELAEKYYGKISAEEVPQRQCPQEPEHPESTVVINYKHKKDQGSSCVSLLYPVSSVDGDLKKLVMSSLLCSYLAGSSDSYLYKKLVTNQKIAHNVMGNIDFSIDPSYAFLEAIPLTLAHQSTVEKILIAELNNFLVEGISEYNLENSKKNLIFNLTYIQDSISKTASYLSRMVEKGVKVEDIKNISSLIESITPEDVMGLARQIFNTPPRLVVFEQPYNPWERNEKSE